MRAERALCLVRVLVGVAILVPSVAAAESRGRELYKQHCAPCHGETGDGQGELAYLVYPRPRDFTRGSFKFRSTPSGEPPTDADLMRTLTNGLPGTAMPSWRGFSEADRRAIVEVVKSFAPRLFAREGHPVAIPDPPGDLSSLATRGRAVFQRMQCYQCHGQGGRGDGPSSATLKDDWGVPSRPFDFTRGARMRGGSMPRDIYRTFMTGVDGTPMPSFADSVPEDERWPLVAYVMSLSRGGARAPTRGPVEVREVEQAALDPNDGIWREGPATTVELRPLWSRDEYADTASVRAVTDGLRLSVLVEWEDARRDQNNFRAQDFRDAIAIQFPVAVDGEAINAADLPFHGMGARSRAMNIWHWKADWQADLGRGVRDLDAIYPRNATGQYPRDSEERAQFYTGRAAGNPLSRAKRTSAGEELNATAPGTLTSQPQESQELEAKGVWAEGKWRVVFRRNLESKDGENGLDVQMAGLAHVPFALAIWDGAAGDRNGQKIVSTWSEMIFPGGGVGGGCALVRLPTRHGAASAAILVAVAATIAVGLGARRSRRPR
ncbi:MAG: c-type cytochrome [Deltaproteobacteria bacterium]|nr:c-type cytochrome [Deltaproteobacteria bacterium]